MHYTVSYCQQFYDIATALQLDLGCCQRRPVSRSGKDREIKREVENITRQITPGHIDF